MVDYLKLFDFETGDSSDTPNELNSNMGSSDSPNSFMHGVPIGSEGILDGVQRPPNIPASSHQITNALDWNLGRNRLEDMFPLSERPYTFGQYNAVMEAAFIHGWLGYSFQIPPIPPPDSRRMDQQTKKELMQKENAITPRICITRVIAVNPTPDNCFDFLHVQYSLYNGECEATIPYEKFSAHKLLESFGGVRATDNKRKLANTVLYEMICMSQWVFISIPSIPGWKYFVYQLDGKQFNKLAYVPTGMTTAYLKSTASFVLHPQSQLPFHRSNAIVGEEYTNMIPQDPMIRSLWAFRITSRLLSLFNGFKMDLDQMLVLEPSNSVSADYLIALLQTQKDSLDSIALNSNKETCNTELKAVNDGMVLFRDTDLLGERKKADVAITCINNDVQQSNSRGREIVSRHMVAVISPYAAELFTSEKVLWISYANTDISFRYSAPTLLEFVQEFDSIVIRTIELNASWTLQTMQKLLQLSETEIPKRIPIYHHRLYQMLITVMRLVNLMFEVPIFVGVDCQYLTDLLCELNTTDLSEQVVEEFSECLNTCIRERKIHVIDRRHTRTFEHGQHIAIAMDNILGLEADTIEKMIRPMMRHQVNLQRIVKILDKANFLYNPEHKHHNNRHTISMNGIDGGHLDAHVYSIDRNLLAPDVRQMIDNLELCDYLIEKDAIPDSDFLPMIWCNGQVVGKMMRYEDEEDNHLSISGQTSSGKTYTLAQRVAFLVDLCHRVVILDAEGAFSNEKLCRMLPSSFVEKTVLFRELETEGIPVDLFHLERKNGNTDKSILEGILTAGSRKLTGPQIDALRTAISNLLQVTNPGDLIHPESIRTMLDEPGAAYENLKARLYPVLEDLSEFKMDPLTWGEFFENNRPIMVLSMQPAFGQSGHKLFDMLLASLYNYQVRNFETPLDIIMDEIQNQNLSEGGPLWKIVTGGRKFQMSVSCATQEYIASRNDTLGSLLGKFRNKIFMSPTSDSETAVASVLGYGNKKKRLFDAMGRGDCIMKMPCYSKAIGQNHYITISGHILSYEEWLNWKE